MVDFNIVTASIISGLIVALASGIIMALLKRHWDKADKTASVKAAEIEDLKKQVSVIRKCIWRLNKTVLIMAKILDSQTDKVHGEELASNLEDIASELLDSPTSDNDESDKG